MKTIRFIGDVHGKFDRYKNIIQSSPHPTIQVGDMGVGFRDTRTGRLRANPPHYAMSEPPGHRFIRGNHDNPEVCRQQSQWIADGHFEDGMFFLGGAVSIDRAYRQEGFSWWPDEELSYVALTRMAARYVEQKPDVMVTHDTAEQIALRITHKLSVPNAGVKIDDGSRTRQVLDLMLEQHRPKLWVFGHWHVPFDEVIEGTRFVCLNELETLDVELPITV